MGKKSKLTLKQQRFVTEYLIDGNARRAAIKAGYSKNTAIEMGYENLTKPHIAEAIDQAKLKQQARTEITADKVLKEIASIAFDDIKNYLGWRINERGKIEVVPKDSDSIDTKNVSEVHLTKHGEFKFKTYSRDEALYKLAHHFGLFKDKLEISGLSNLPQEMQDRFARIISHPEGLVLIQQIFEQIDQHPHVKELVGEEPGRN